MNVVFSDDQEAVNATVYLVEVDGRWLVGGFQACVPTLDADPHFAPTAVYEREPQP